ncbi:hypothetical protein Pmani_032219 [Petrolisthes manimaculis]|uniref:Uncharacterized protein n=1 Tax=Petrolisthes manimaculis TaxID=1843537 RepID=A0AAE1TRV4_9EUCA|nr:hypothetical protein Pmani_032219 [Petrolisthes manimaculis]
MPPIQFVSSLLQQEHCSSDSSIAHMFPFSGHRATPHQQHTLLLSLFNYSAYMASDAHNLFTPAQEYSGGLSPSSFSLANE